MKRWFALISFLFFLLAYPCTAPCDDDWVLVIAGPAQWQGRTRKVELLVKENPGTALCTDGTESDMPIQLTAATVPAEALDSDNDNQDDCGDWLIYDNGNSDSKNGYEAPGTNPASIDTNRLPLEIVKCSMTSGGAGASLEVYVGEVTVNCDDQNIDRSLVLYYRDAQGDESQPAADAAHGSEDVWNSGYKAVYHFTETSGDAADSTSNDTDLTNVNDPGSYASCDWNGDTTNCRSFDGSTEYFTVATPITAYPLSMIGLVRPDVIEQESTWASISDVSASPVLASGNLDDDSTFASTTWDGSTLGEANSSSTYAATTWYCVAGVYTGLSDRDVFVAGTNEDTDTTTITTPTGQDGVTIGAQRWSGSPRFEFDGFLDEIRISNVARSDDYISAETKFLISAGTYVVEQTPTNP